MEKLIVSNFLNIKYIELDIGKINILIGPQAQGKSIIAKLVYFFQSFWHDYCTFLYSDEQKILDQVLLDKFREIFPDYSWTEQSFKISYFFKEYEITLVFDSKNNAQQGLIINYSSFQEIGNDFREYKEICEKVYDECINDLFNNQSKQIEQIAMQNIEEFLIELKKKFPNLTLQEQSSLSQDYLTKFKDYSLVETKEILKNSMEFKQMKNERFKEYILTKSLKNYQDTINQKVFFIPSGRSFYSFLKENIFSLVDKFQFEYFMKAFGNIYNRSDTKYEYQNRTKKDNYNSMIDRLTERILKGEYTYEQEIDFISSKDGRKTRLIDASSGQQEVLPIIVLLSAFGLADDNCFFFIEEPEAHLFPAAQNDIVNLISLIYNLTGKKHSFFLTTHSPYVLTAFNTLIQADNTYKKIIAENRLNQLSDLFKIVPENQIIDLEDVRVYSLENGEIKSIINTDNQLIDANIIDEISNCTGEQFDKLLDLEFNNG